MKRLLTVCILLLTFCGCNATDSLTDESLALRQQLLKSQGCKFIANISADYQDSLYNFTLKCEADNNDTLMFTVLHPESISGITGTLSNEGGKLTFDDKMVAFPLLADGLFSPVSGPWIFLHAIKNGHIKSSGKDADGFRMSINDTYSGEALIIEIYMNQDNIYKYAEVFWQSRRIMSIEITDFVYV